MMLSIEDCALIASERYEGWHLREQFLAQSASVFSIRKRISVFATALHHWVEANSWEDPAVFTCDDKYGRWLFALTYSQTLHCPILLVCECQDGRRSSAGLP